MWSRNTFLDSSHQALCNGAKLFFFFWSTIFDDFGYFLMILGVFGAIRVVSRPTKCLTGDITSTLGGIRNVVEVVGGWPQL